MKPSLLKELVAIANRLDQKGFGKEADVLDGIIKSAYPGEQSMGEQLANRDMSSFQSGGEVADMDFELPEAIEGSRQRYLDAKKKAEEALVAKESGDPYGYTFDLESGCFIIAEAPAPTPEQIRSGKSPIGAKLCSSGRYKGAWAKLMSFNPDLKKAWEIKRDRSLAEMESQAQAKAEDAMSFWDYVDRWLDGVKLIERGALMGMFD